MKRRDAKTYEAIGVSVPSRGAIFLNVECDATKAMLFEFPSPLGELYFLIYVCFLVVT